MNGSDVVRRGAYGFGGVLCMLALVVPMFVNGLSSSATQYETSTTTSTSTSTTSTSTTSTSTTTSTTTPPTTETSVPSSSSVPPPVVTSTTAVAVTSTTVPSDGAIPEVVASPGDTVSVSGTGCDPGAEVVVTLDETEYLATFTSDAAGNFVGEIVVPSSTSLGTHLVTAVCSGPDQATKVRDGQFGGATSAGGVVRQFLRLIVVEAASSSTVPVTEAPAAAPGSGSGSGGAMPRTGSNTVPLVVLGLASFVIGATFLYGARHRRIG